MVKITLYTYELKKIGKRLTFTKQDYYGQENLESYVTPMIGASHFVTKRYIWYVGT